MQSDTEVKITRWFSKLERKSQAEKDLSINSRATQKDAQSSCDIPVSIQDEDVWSPKLPRTRPPGLHRALVSSIEMVRFSQNFRAQFQSDSPVQANKRQGDPREQKSGIPEGIFDSQGDVIHHQPDTQWLLEGSNRNSALFASHDRTVEYVLGGTCPFCKTSFMEDDVPSTEERMIRDWDRGAQFKSHLWMCEKSADYKAYVKEQHQRAFWCDHCELLSLQLWHSSSPANLASAFPLGKAWPASWFFFECDGGCPNSDFSLRTVKVNQELARELKRAIVQSIAELKQTGFVPYFCFDCRAFTKQARLIHAITQQAQYLTMNSIEPLMDCKFGCSKHDTLKQLKEQKDAEWGKYWCNKCEIYSADYRAQEIDLKIRHGTVPPCFSRCTCNENFYWCTECRCHSKQLWQQYGRSYMEPDDAVPNHFKRCPVSCKRRQGDDAALCMCDDCKVPTSTRYKIEKRKNACPYKDWPECRCKPAESSAMEREDSAQGYGLAQMSLTETRRS